MVLRQQRCRSYGFGVCSGGCPIPIRGVGGVERRDAAEFILAGYGCLAGSANLTTHCAPARILNELDNTASIRHPRAVIELLNANRRAGNARRYCRTRERVAQIDSPAIHCRVGLA